MFLHTQFDSEVIDALIKEFKNQETETIPFNLETQLSSQLEKHAFPVYLGPLFNNINYFLLRL